MADTTTSEAAAEAAEETPDTGDATTDSASTTDSETAESGSEPAAAESKPLEEQLEEWKAHAKRWESRARKSQGAEARLAEVEASRAELEQKVSELEGKVSAMTQEKELQQLAEEIVKDSGVPAGLLRGNSEEELRAHFEQLTEFVAAGKSERSSVPAAPEGQPVPLNGGGLEDALKRALGMS